MNRVIHLLMVSVSAWTQASVFIFNSHHETAQLSTHLSSVREGSQSLQISLQIPKIELTEGTQGMQELSVPGLIPNGDIGSPEVSSTGVLVAIPPGYQLQIGGIEVSEKTVDGVRIQPTQKKTRCASASTFSMNRSVYSQTEAYPNAWLTLEHVGYLQSVELVRVALNPTRWEPQSQTLRIATDLKATLTFEQIGEIRSVRLSPAVEQLLQVSVANPAMLITRAEPFQTMVILVADAYKDLLGPLVSWKQQRGIQTKVVTFTETGGTKEKAKEWLQQYYDQSAVKPSYLLIVGNQSSFPGFTEDTVNGKAISDYQYTLLSGGDPIPDILYGRIAADEASDVNNQVRRWIQYEKNPSNEETFTFGTTIASKDTLNGHPYDNEYTAMIQQSLKQHTYKKFDDYWQKTGNATPANITTSLQEGRSWLTYIGHGSGTSWGSTNGSFNVQSIESLKAPNVLPVIIDVACLNGSWAGAGKSFGEAWVKHTVDGKDAGAVAYWGSSQSTNWHEPAVMSVGSAEAIQQKNLEGLSQILVAGLLHLSAKMGTGENVISNYRWYNLLGDPSLSTRTRDPKNYDVAINGHEMRSGSRFLKVRATDASGAGVSNLAVVLTDSQEGILASQKTDATGTVWMPDPGTGNSALVTTSGYNYMTVQRSLRD